MKKAVTFILICAFFLVLVMLVLFKLVFHSSTKQINQQSRPSFPLVTAVNEQDQSSPEIRQLQKAFFNKIINSNKITIERAKIVFPYAIQDWSDTNKGGEALLKYASSTGWELITMGGGAWDVQSLIAEEVPSDIARQLAGQ